MGHTADTISRALEILQRGDSVTDVAKALGCPRTTVSGWHSAFQSGGLRITAEGVMLNGQIRPWSKPPTPATETVTAEPASSPDPPAPSPKERLAADAMHPPVDTVADKDRIRDLEAEVARLQQQLSWAQEAESTTRTGGVLTIRRSDDHHGDKNHLLSCARSLTEKVKVLVQQYEPDRIRVVGFDDWIAGRGIYKEQDLDSATSDVNQQIAVGAIKARRFLEVIREASTAPVTCHCLRGNHEYAMGVSMAESLFFQCKVVCESLADVDFQYHWDNATVNLAAEGTYNVLVRHGHGYSKHSPNSPAFIDAIKDELLVKQRQMQPHEQYRRILSGHTHWLTAGLERIHGLYWDTTGGLQRNTRVRIGDNQRPVGWIVYMSPDGMTDNILQPLSVRPDDDTYQREIADPHLASANYKDVADCLEEYSQLLAAQGVFAEAASFGKLNEGRW
jgi:transposase-like protein